MPHLLTPNPPTPAPTLTRYIIYAVSMCSVFVLLEGIEIVGSGPIEYFMNMWNVMDWLNFAIFFLTWATMLALDDYVANRECGHICSTVGCSARHPLTAVGTTSARTQGGMWPRHTIKESTSLVMVPGRVKVAPALLTLSMSCLN